MIADRIFCDSEPLSGYQSKYQHVIIVIPPPSMRCVANHAAHAFPTQDSRLFTSISTQLLSYHAAAPQVEPNSIIIHLSYYYIIVYIINTDECQPVMSSQAWGMTIW